MAHIYNMAYYVYDQHNIVISVSDNILLTGSTTSESSSSMCFPETGKAGECT